MLAMAHSAVMLHDRRIEHVAVERIDRRVKFLLRLSMSGRSKSSKGNAQDCKTLHHSSPYFMSAHVGSVISSASVLPIGRGDSAERRHLVAASIGASESPHRWQEKLP
jgi:hypothetical protein